MYFSSAKAVRELGYAPDRRDAIADAVGWFRANGYLVTTGTADVRQRVPTALDPSGKWRSGENFPVGPC